MNKTSVVRNVSEISGVDLAECEKVMDALQKVLNDELASSKNRGKAFDKIYDAVWKSLKIMSLFRNN